jgi:HEAT repeat protein
MGTDKPETEEKKTEEVREEALSIDARLLSDAVIELNISRRNVGLYPQGHIRITSAIERAYNYLEKLFELRSTIFLGITKDSLIIDDKALDSRNPVFKECARSFHNLGLAGITFQSGVKKEELIKLHEMMTMQDPLTAKAFVDEARKRGINHLKLNAVDYSSFKFMEDELRAGGKGGTKDIWEDYVYGLLHGSLAVGDASSMILKAPPKELAQFLEKAMDEDDELGEDAYNRVVTSYMSTKGDVELSSEGLKKIVSLMDNLSAEKKDQFLKSTVAEIGTDIHQVENVLKDMTSNDLGNVTRFFTDHASKIPPSFKSIIDKFTELKADKDFSFDITTGSTSIVHDIELDDGMAALFDEDHYQTFVSDGYQKQLDRMMATKVRAVDLGIKELETEVKDDVIDRVTSDILLEVMALKEIETEEFMKLLTTLTTMAGDFIDTGRFEEALNIYTAIRSHSFTGKFTQAAQGTVEYYFKSEQFIERVLIAARIWGRTNREEAARLLRAFKGEVIEPLIEALIEESSASYRKYLLTMLMEIGSDIMPEVRKRLSDKRWYVVRNMLILARKCGTPDLENSLKKLARHKDRRVWSEALRALFTFKSKYAFPLLKFGLVSEDYEDREVALKIAGAYRVKEAAPMLIEILEKKDVFGAGAYDKISVVRVLGDIGETEAIPKLERLLGAKSFIFKGLQKDLKEEIYKSLAGYPLDFAKHLYEEGLETDNEDILRICRQALLASEGKKKD